MQHQPMLSNIAIVATLLVCARIPVISLAGVNTSMEPAKLPPIQYTTNLKPLTIKPPPSIPQYVSTRRDESGPSNYSASTVGDSDANMVGTMSAAALDQLFTEVAAESSSDHSTGVISTDPVTAPGTAFQSSNTYRLAAPDGRSQLQATIQTSISSSTALEPEMISVDVITNGDNSFTVIEESRFRSQNSGSEVELPKHLSDDEVTIAINDMTGGAIADDMTPDEMSRSRLSVRGRRRQFKPDNAQKQCTATSISVISCPKGWVAVGDLCMTVSQVRPFTQCPYDKQPFKRTSSSHLTQEGSPGVCELVFKEAPYLTCPDSFTLENDQFGEVMCCSPELSYPLPGAESCAAGYSKTPQQICISQSIRYPPIPKCPENYHLMTQPVSQYAFHNKSHVECIRRVKLKGRLFCPDSFILVNEPYKDIIFGNVITDDEEEYRFHAQFKNAVGLSVRNSENLIDLLDKVTTNSTGASCLAFVAASSCNCDAYRCSTPEVNRLRAIVGYWEYDKFSGSYARARYDALPTGADRRYSEPGWLKTLG